MTETKPKRRWFRFSLRTLFVLVTLVGVWLGLEIQQIRQRANMLKWLDERPPVDAVFVTPGYDATQNEFNRWRYLIDDAYLSWFRRFLGDHFITTVVYPDEATADELRHVKRMFPEASFEVWDGPVG